MSADIKPTAAELIAFLNGSGTIDGFAFGERHPNERGLYWWRKYLHVLEAAPASSAMASDTQRIDWLEDQINRNGAIHLHDGSNPAGHGLGLRPGALNRSLRDAIDKASQQSPVQASDAGRQG